MGTSSKLKQASPDRRYCPSAFTRETPLSPMGESRPVRRSPARAKWCSEDPAAARMATARGCMNCERRGDRAAQASQAFAAPAGSVTEELVGQSFSRIFMAVSFFGSCSAHTARIGEPLAQKSCTVSKWRESAPGAGRTASHDERALAGHTRWVPRRIQTDGTGANRGNGGVCRVVSPP